MARTAASEACQVLRLGAALRQRVGTPRLDSSGLPALGEMRAIINSYDGHPKEGGRRLGLVTLDADDGHRT